MRKSLKRAATLVAGAPLVAAGLVVSAPAAHAAPTCPFGTEVTEFDFIVGGHYRVAAAAVSPTEYNVCIQLIQTATAVVVLKTGVAITPPNVTTTPGTGACATKIIDMTAPTELELSVGTSTTGPSICLGKDGTTTTLSFSAASVNTLPDVDVWLPANSYLLVWGYCAPQYAQYTANPSSANQYNWQNCYSFDRKLA